MLVKHILHFLHLYLYSLYDTPYVYNYIHILIDWSLRIPFCVLFQHLSKVIGNEFQQILFEKQTLKPAKSTTPHERNDVVTLSLRSTAPQ